MASSAEDERAVEQALALANRVPPHESSPYDHSPPDSSRHAPSPSPSIEDRAQPSDRADRADRADRSSGPTPPAASGSAKSGSAPSGSAKSDSAKSGSVTSGPAESVPESGPAAVHRPPVTHWEQARALAVRAGRRSSLPAIRLPLDSSLGHVLAEGLAALTDLPSFDTSAMDGWAVTGPGPWRFGGGSGLLAGDGGLGRLPDGEAVRIATGARIPTEATAVIRSEHAAVDEAKEMLHARHTVVPGQDIRPRAQECRTGEQLLAPGTLVTPAVLGLAAAAGYDALVVVPRPRVEVLVLGDELLTSGLPHGGRIRDALGPMLGPWLRAAGADVADPRCLGDDPEALRRALTTTEAELVVTTGGTAAGPVDHVHPILSGIGADMVVDGVAVRPGHPMLLARLAPDGPCLVGLPGNPLAAVSGLLTLALPLLGSLAGRVAQEPYRALVHDAVQGHPHDTRLVPVVHRAGRGETRDHVVPLRYNGPAMLRGIATADGMAVVPPGGLRPGAEVEILDLPWA
ncbi:molybdopterin molybdotransferase MoeA [Streptomyces sp. NPDC005892]|uniref:molybdopterin molybdotransferase MoeA n=1 Tax=Streptomyces sp. NPDC005892 TaxID=3155593 RepID=UPI0033FD37BD